MSLHRMQHPLRRQVLAPRSDRLFQEARRREPALAPHASVDSVLGWLASGTGRPWTEREALCRALLREQQRAPGPFWAAVLLLAFLPTLLGLRGRIRGDQGEREEIDQTVLVVFLDVATRFPLSERLDRTAMFLRQDTQRAVFRLLNEEQRDRQRLAALALEAHGDDGFELFATPAPRARGGPDPGGKLAVLLRQLVRGHIPEARLELVIATVLRGEGLREHAVRRLPASASAEAQQRAYQRVKRERLRTLERLRVLLPPSPATFTTEEQGS